MAPDLYGVREELIGIDLHWRVILEHRHRIPYIGAYIRRANFDFDCFRLRPKSVVSRTDGGPGGATFNFANSAVGPSIHVNFRKESTKDSRIASTIETTFARMT